MHWTTLGAFIALETVLCFIPGPAVMAVVGSTLGGRARTGVATACGILTGNAVYFVVSALGIASALLASHEAFIIIKWLGSAYLAYLGIRTLVSPATHPLDSGRAQAAGRFVRGWANGTITQLANPKALVFFAAILPQFIDPHGRIALQIVILGVSSLAVEFCVLSTYIAGADRVSRRGIEPRSHALTERIGGAFLLGVAAAVLRESP